MSTPREQILAWVRKANGGATAVAEASAAWTEIARAYEQALEAPRDAVLALFAERLRDYDATVVFCSPEALTDAVIEAAALAGMQRLAVAAGFALVEIERLLRSGIEASAGDDMSAAELNTVQGVLTASTLGIAETGTLVLQGVPGQGTRASTLVPDVHFCVVRAADVVATVPEAIAKLQATAELPTTFVSGPSATADIEMTRIKGVHGPRFLHVFVLN
jgi:L-lactate dehydrogenase complex protein LldG